MDLNLWGDGSCMLEEWVDVTLTHPYKRATRVSAACTDGAAVGTAEEKKRKRYGKGAGGVSCAPFGLELWGRGGASALSLLDRLASQLRARDGARPRHSVTGRWRAELGVALYRAMAATVACAVRPQPTARSIANEHLAAPIPEPG